VDYTAELVDDIFRKNAKVAMKTIKRLGARFAFVASVINIRHVRNVKSFQIQMIARCSTILFRKLLLSYFGQNRAACIKQISDVGIQGHAEKMAEHKLQSLKR